MMTAEEKSTYVDKKIEDHYTKYLPKTIELYEEIAASFEERRISDLEWRQSIEEMKASIAEYEAEKAKEKAADELQPEF
jgi:thymidylate kinase